MQCEQLTLRLLKCLNHKDILLGHCSFYAEHIQEVVANKCFVLRHSNDSYYITQDPPSTFTGSRILFANKTKLWRHQRDNKSPIRKPEWKKNNNIITVIYIIAVEHEIEKFN